jgi:hypothetical protein
MENLRLDLQSDINALELALTDLNQYEKNNIPAPINALVAV